MHFRPQQQQQQQQRIGVLETTNDNDSSSSRGTRQQPKWFWVAVAVGTLIVLSHAFSYFSLAAAAESVYVLHSPPPRTHQRWFDLIAPPPVPVLLFTWNKTAAAAAVAGHSVCVCVCVWQREKRKKKREGKRVRAGEQHELFSWWPALTILQPPCSTWMPSQRPSAEEGTEKRRKKRAPIFHSPW